MNRRAIVALYLSASALTVQESQLTADFRKASALARSYPGMLTRS